MFNNLINYFIVDKMDIRPRRTPVVIPESSEDENVSDDDNYNTQDPLHINEENETSSSDRGDGDEDEEGEEELDPLYLEFTEEHVATSQNFTENHPSTSQAASSSKKKINKDKLVWSDDNLRYDESNITFLGSEALPDEIMQLSTPMEFFKFLFPSSAVNLIEEESNVYAAQISSENLHLVTHEDIYKFIGVIIYMSVVHLPTTRHYWKEGTYIEKVANVMTCNKFEEIKRYLHFFDKTKELKPSDPQFDRLQKIRPLIKILRERLLKVPKEEFLSIDEQMIPTKAKTSGIRQYNAKKPHKWGYLNYVLSGVSGFSYDFELYAGKYPDPPENCPNLGVPGNVVQRLLETVPHNLNHKVFVDNWYTSLQLMAILHKKGIMPLGTIQLRRAPNINITKKTLERKERGYCSEKTVVVDDVQLSVTNWVDNKAVSLCSSFVGKEPMGVVKRYSKKHKYRVDVPCPKAVSIYNKYMGGVDLLDAMLGFYRIKIRSKKWYHRQFFHFIDLCCVNSWLLWRRVMKQRGENVYIPLLDFKLTIADVLMHKDSKVYTPTTRKRGRPLHENVEAIKKGRSRRRIELPPVEVAGDGFNHWPEWKTDRQRCKMEGCKQKSQVMCKKCRCYLCFNKDRNCFINFHI